MVQSQMQTITLPKAGKEQGQELWPRPTLPSTGLGTSVSVTVSSDIQS